MCKKKYVVLGLFDPLVYFMCIEEWLVLIKSFGILIFHMSHSHSSTSLAIPSSLVVNLVVR